MASAREVLLRIGSIKNIAQVTRALQAVSTSKVQKAMQALYRTRPYATKAWQVLTHLAEQPGRDELHPLLSPRRVTKNVVVVMISGDRGLAGAYNSNLVRFVLEKFGDYKTPLKYVTIGRKGRDLMIRRRQPILAEFSDLPAAPSFGDVSAIGMLVIDEFLSGKADEVFLVYSDFVNMVKQIPTVKKLLPLEFETGKERVRDYKPMGREMIATYLYEPGQEEILDRIIPRFTALQVYQAVLESLASEHAARMVAMKNATENASELGEALQLQYNKARQQNITSEMIDIAGGAEALAQ